jgi:hypothetical protein
MILDDVYVVERFGHVDRLLHLAVRLPLFVALAAAGWWFSRASHGGKKVATEH